MFRLLVVPLLFIAGCSFNPDEDLGRDSTLFYGGGPKEISPSVILARVLRPQTFAVWSTGTHTAAPVVIGSIGPARYTARLKGLIQNTDIAPVMETALSEGTDVILVIGDGMGPMQLALPVYMRIDGPDTGTTFFEKILREGETGLCLTNAWDMLVTCSAASATAISSGYKTRLSMLGTRPDGSPVTTVLNHAASLGKATGLLTDTRLTHATPAAFYAHNIKRQDEAAIAAALAAESVQVLMGGGAAWFVPESTVTGDHPLLKGMRSGASVKSARKDRRDLLSEMTARGYALAINGNTLAIAAGKPKILGLFAGSGMNAAIDRDDENTGEPELPAMTDAALASLSSGGKGFFLMVECGQIDWAAHDNDAGAVLKSMEEMDRVLEKGYRAWKARPDKTLLIFTADHETGGFGIAYAYAPLPNPVKLPSGEIWQTASNGLPWKELAKYRAQKKSLSAMVESSETPAGLMEQVRSNTVWTLSAKDAARVLKAAGK